MAKKYFVKAYILKHTYPNGRIYMDYHNAYDSREQAESLARDLSSKRVIPNADVEVREAKIYWEEPDE